MKTIYSIISLVLLFVLQGCYSGYTVTRYSEGPGYYEVEETTYEDEDYRDYDSLSGQENYYNDRYSETKVSRYYYYYQPGLIVMNYDPWYWSYNYYHYPVYRHWNYYNPYSYWYWDYPVVNHHYYYGSNHHSDNSWKYKYRNDNYSGRGSVERSGYNYNRDRDVIYGSGRTDTDRSGTIQRRGNTDNETGRRGDAVSRRNNDNPQDRSGVTRRGIDKSSPLPDMGNKRDVRRNTQGTEKRDIDSRRWNQGNTENRRQTPEVQRRSEPSQRQAAPQRSYSPPRNDGPSRSGNVPRNQPSGNSGGGERRRR